MKKILLSIVATVTLLTTTIAAASIVSPSKASASFKLMYTRDGYFTNYVTSKAYTGNDYSKSIKTFTLKEGYINSSSSVTGTYKVYIQTRKNSNYSWKTVKTVYAKKKGKTNFTSPKIPNHYQYRFYTVNSGTKKKVTFHMAWIPLGN